MPASVSHSTNKKPKRTGMKEPKSVTAHHSKIRENRAKRQTPPPVFAPLRPPTILAPLQHVPKAPSQSAATPSTPPAPPPPPPQPTVTQTVAVQANVAAVPVAPEKIIKPLFNKMETKGGRKASSSMETAPSTDRPAIKTTVRKRRPSTSSSNESANSIPSPNPIQNQKASAETDKKSRHQPASDSPRRRSSEKHEKKSEGSKEPSENERIEKIVKKKSAEKDEHEAAKARMRAEDAKMERMPESSQLNASARAFRKKPKAPPPKQTDLFKKNGDPFWLQEEVPDDNQALKADAVSNPVLAQAMACDDRLIDEFNWQTLARDSMVAFLPRSDHTEDNFVPDPYGPSETIEKLEFMSEQDLKSNTTRFMVEHSSKRFEKKEEIEEHRRPRVVRASSPPEAPAPAPPKPSSQEPVQPEKQEKQETSTATAPVSDPSAEQPSAETPSAEGTKQATTFDMTQTFRIIYDRHHPLASIRKFRKKYGFAIEKPERTAQQHSKENS